MADAVKVEAAFPAPAVTWDVGVAGEDHYEVHARWTAAADRATDATYTIAAADGNHTVRVNQRHNGGEWVLLGSYRLDGASTVSLSVDGADGVVVADGIRVAGAATGGNPDIYYAHTDHLGTPQVITDDLQAPVWEADYTPFGQASIVTEVITNNVRFPGQYFDSEIGLHYNYFRYYDPTTGRYLTSDPIGLDGGINTYLYANANPLRFIDPTGEFAFLALIPAFAGGGTATAGGVAGGISLGGAGKVLAALGLAGIVASISGDVPKEDCDDDEEECLDEIEDCIQTCIMARNNKHRMRKLWGGSWWRCMTGCVSFACQEYLDERKHGER